MLFARSLRAWREYRTLTLEQLAKKAGMTKSAVWQLELDKTKPRGTTKQRLAEALKIQPEDFGKLPEIPESSTKPTLEELLEEFDVLYSEGGLGPEEQDKIYEKLLIIRKLDSEKARKKK